DECGIELPAPGTGRPGRHWARGLTDEQRDCLRDQGLERPADGERPTGDERDARRQAFRDAADECGIELPTRPALPDDGSGTGTTTD
ncbi:MAG: hypothetical protein KC635_23050, partial [Myxococcales bacterium]|nr:hypothetical protein [Myxococcales bacterium]